MVYVLGILWPVVIAIIVSFGFIFLPELWMRWLIFLVISVVVFIINLILNQLGYTRIACVVLTTLIWLFITIPCYSAGGIFAPGIITQASVILTAGFLLGWRGGLIFGLLTIGVDFWMAYMQVQGNLPAPSVIHTPITRWISSIIPFGTILALQYYATNHLRSGLIALQREISKREEAEKVTNQTLYNLKERVKELNTLQQVSIILQDDDAPLTQLFQEIVNIIPPGWQYPEITEARICYSEIEYTTSNFKKTIHCQRAEVETENGSLLSIEVVYMKDVPESDEGPFLKEERNMINILAEMIKMNLNRREHRDELKDYKYALDIGYMVSISNADTKFTYVNDNFCKASQYDSTELIGKDFSIITSGIHSSQYFQELNIALSKGKPYRGEFCNKTKDGKLYWVETTILPFLDDNKNVYQYLSINHDITERKVADEKIKQSEQLLKKITSQIPGNTYMFEIAEDGQSNIFFISRGTDSINHAFEFEELAEKPDRLREVLFEDDKIKFNDAMKEAYRSKGIISFQYRIVINDTLRWRWMQAVPEEDQKGNVIWYGSTSDITPLADYLASIEQIIFDIGHVIRRPVSNLLGMSKLITDSEISESEIKDVAQKLYLISEEMDKFIHELNENYQEKRQNPQFNIDISLTIDKRNSLFN